MECFISLLGKNYSSVGADADASVERKTVPAPGKGRDIMGWVIAKGGVVPLPIAIESYLPNPIPWETDGVGRPRSIGEIGDYDDVVTSSPL